MTIKEIAERAKRLGEQGADMRTALVDVELTLKRTLTAPEVAAFHDGWKASWPARDAKQAKRDRAAADQARSRR